MKRLCTWLRRPYDVFRSPRRRWLFTFGIAGFTWFFLALFGVFDFDYYPPGKRIAITGVYGLGCGIALAWVFFALQPMLFRVHHIGNTILIILLLLFFIGCSNALLTSLAFRFEPFSLHVFLKMQFFTLSLGFIITPLAILGHQVWLMNHRNAPATTREPAGEESARHSVTAGEELVLESDYKHGGIRLLRDDLLFVCAADNYVDVWYARGGEVKHTLIRNTLSRIEQEVGRPVLERCHRSYLVNPGRVRSVRRENGQVHLDLGCGDVVVPVSRKYEARFRHIRP
ncbi:MAG: LytTR family DNA-binding domain-containing protein [Bacteroidales bacterium]